MIEAKTLIDAGAELRAIRRELLDTVPDLPTVRERNAVRRRARRIRKVALGLEVAAHDDHGEAKKAALDRVTARVGA